MALNSLFCADVPLSKATTLTHARGFAVGGRCGGLERSPLWGPRHSETSVVWGVPPSTRNIFHWFCTNFVSGPGGEWGGGFNPHQKNSPVASPLATSGSCSGAVRHCNAVTFPSGNVRKTPFRVPCTTKSNL